MTVRVDLAEFITAYIAEVDEQLANATAKLLTIDDGARKGERQPRAVRDLFRAMHTIKGLSAMVGIEPIVTVAHRIESVVRGLDAGRGAVTPVITDLMLQSVRFIEQGVRLVEKGSSAPEPAAALLSALDAIVLDDAIAVARAGARLTLDVALDQKLEPFEREALLKGVREGKRAVRLDYAPTPTRAAQGWNINSVRERLGAIAEVVRVIPISLAGTGAAAGGIAFALLLLTLGEDAELAAAAGVEPGDVSVIVEADADSSRRDAEPAPISLVPEADPRADEAPRRNLLRVDAARVDDAMERLATLIVTRSRMGRAIARLTEAGADTRELTQIAHENARQLRDLRSSILQVRMVPITEILERIPLMLRALMRTSGRQVRLEVEAAGAELDKAVAERIFPAIVHLVRNAVDHGIEPPEARASAGKPPEGVVRISCSARSNTRLELTIHDDGRGIDVAAVARRLGVGLPDSDAGLLDLLCQPGFSTRDEATTTSGRGFGMDIVKRIAVDQLGGELSMQSRLGRGTTFTVQIPLTIAIVDAFVVECAGDRFVIPVSIVEEILEVSPERCVMPPGAAGRSAAVRPVGMIERRGETLLLYALSSLLGAARPSAREQRALVIRRAGEPIGFLLDRVVGQQEAVIRPLVDPLVRVPGISAATDLGDGRPTLVLDPTALAGQVQRRMRALSAQAIPLLADGVSQPSGERP